MRVGPLFAFRAVPVTLFSVVTYAVLISVLLSIHLSPAPVPSSTGLANLTSAWQSLQTITASPHPYNSRANDAVHAYLLSSISSLLSASPGRAELIEDRNSSVLFHGRNAESLAVYFEGTNIIVGIHGSNSSLAPVLVNAHYDSVSTGYGATDNGMGVVTLLEIVRVFTSGPQYPRGIIALFNNGEEDFLNGAQAFRAHPLSQLPKTFLNLEGAGAGGRALLFRANSKKLINGYGKSSHPFANVIAKDGFEQGLIRSETDYSVFTAPDWGMRGLDLAFYGPRSRYHTENDDARHTGYRSLWHMLGSSIAVLESACSDASKSGSKNEPKTVYFDLFSSTLLQFSLRGMFGFTIAAVILSPLVLLGMTILLVRNSKIVVSRYSILPALRFPAALVFATGVSVGLAFLIKAVNPFIPYSSPYVLYTFFISLWVTLAWLVLYSPANADEIREWALVEQFLLWLAASIFTIVLDRKGVGSGYPVVGTYLFVFAASFLGLLVKLTTTEPAPLLSSDDAPENTDEDPTESTSLLSHQDQDHDHEHQHTHSFFNRAYHSITNPSSQPPPPVSSSPESNSFIWLPQFLVAVPIPLILWVPIALLLSASISQTASDGGATSTPLLAIAAFSTLLLIPLTPFLPRFHGRFVLLLFIVAVASGIYSLAAFPFDERWRFKIYFREEWNLDDGTGVGALFGADARYLGPTIRSMPSAAGKEITYGNDDVRAGLLRATWPLEKRRFGNWIMDVKVNTSTIVVDAEETKACKILFEEGVKRVNVRGREMKSSEKEVVKELRLWRRDWKGAWEVQVEIEEGDSMKERVRPKGRVVCEWNQGGTVKEEVERYFPAWAVGTKYSDGLVEVSKAL